MNRVQFEVDCKRPDSRYYGMEMEEVYLPIKGRTRTHHRRLHNNNNTIVNNNNNRVITLSPSDFVSVDLIRQKVNVDVQQRTPRDDIESSTHDANLHRHSACDANLQRRSACDANVQRDLTYDTNIQRRSTCDASESRQSIFEGVVPPPNQCVTPYANLTSLPMEQV